MHLKPSADAIGLLDAESVLVHRHDFLRESVGARPAAAPES